MNALVRLLYPVRCKLCGAALTRGILCEACFVQGEFSLYDRFRIPGASGADAALEYQDFVRRAMHAYKFQHRRAYADWFAEVTGDCLAGWLDDWKPDVLTFVPLSCTRWLRRGYNQSALVARLMAKRHALPCEGMLRKRGFVRTQSSLGHSDRLRNVQNAFAVRRDAQIAGRRIVLIDDIITTGATAQICVSQLQEAGAESVFVLGMAKTPVHGGRVRPDLPYV